MRSAVAIDGPAPGGHVIGNHRVGTLVFLMAGVMFFAGLVSAYLVLRYAGRVWPAPGMPRLPVLLAGFNTAVIALSSLALLRATRALRADDAGGVRRNLALAAALGSAFLVLQVVQWSTLFAAGLSFAGTTYGTTFYVLTGAHAAHAIVGVVWLLWMSLGQRTPRVAERGRRAIEAGSMYWHFVGLVWVALYLVLYLL
jgi:cytochrome c oxidase subunit 3